MTDRRGAPRIRSTGPRRHRRRARAIDDRLGGRAHRPRARDLLRHVERALLLQVLAAAPADAADRRRGVVAGPARTPAHRDRRRARGRVQDRVAQPSHRPWSRSRARRPGWAASCATSSRWGRARSRCSTRCASATRRSRARATSSTAWSTGSAATATASGCPTVGGELVFDPTYQANPLVNVMAIGLLDERRLTLAARRRPGNLVVLFGSTTGRDGIGGASVLALGHVRPTTTRRSGPSVQVGRPVRREAPDRGIASS